MSAQSRRSDGPAGAGAHADLPPGVWSASVRRCAAARWRAASRTAGRVARHRQESRYPAARAWSAGRANSRSARSPGACRSAWASCSARWRRRTMARSSVAETELPGLTDHCVVPATHMGLVFSDEAAAQTVCVPAHGALRARRLNAERMYPRMLELLHGQAF